MDLEDFTTACKLPQWGNVHEPHRSEYKDFLASITVGESKHIGQATIGSIHFPAIHYFALFIGRCISGKDEACHMCVPNLCVLKSAESGYKGYNLGAIVACRLHNNNKRGDFFGGIYATHVANFLHITPREGDMIVPPVYLDKEAMFDHHCVERNEQFLHYRLTYNRRNVVPITLPAPYLFGYQTKGRHVFTREEATEYERGMEAARQHAAAQEALAAASPYNPSYNFGYQSGYPWP